MDKKRLIITALSAALLSAGGASFAQDRYHGGDRNDGRYDQRGPDRGDRHDDRGDRRDDRRPDRGPDRGHYDGRDNRRWDGAGPSHDLRRGGRLPNQYRNRQYVVDDWRGHRLRQPPRGYHWVQTGGDYVLAAIATGVIADILINR
ncbi:RcnB family protein [Massilia forsythiae]|uniref:RcnB family protein n=1 Tax=Massilia forsythiae TaxID=2728020 RepID=A0A7Z2VTV9_9BURK|nr:RcnB family protein [Massilia forsythiae]QJD99105.1 RcnB family protein [Massilia forsythiae]